MKIYKILISFIVIIIFKKTLIAKEETPFSLYNAELKNENVKDFSYSNSFSNDTIIFPFNKIKTLTSIYISGNIKLFSRNSSVRIILKDTQDFEYLVYESNYLTCDSLYYQFENKFDETGILDSITPYSLNIKIKNAQLDISDISYTDKFLDKNNKIKKLKSELLEYQREQKVVFINSRISDLNLKWIAGETPISKMSYEEKRDFFGDTVPDFMGFEYYIGGLFEIPSNDTDNSSNSSGTADANDTQSSSSSSSSSGTTSTFDWRDRHGVNWNSSIKNQNPYGTCWAHAAVGATEALVNLYYNKKIDLDLSEYQIVLCGGLNTTCNSGGSNYKALGVIATDGIVNQDCFPNDCSASCSDMCSSPSERIFIGGKKYFIPGNYSDPVEELKAFIVSTGVVCGRISSWSHSMALSGFGTIEVGDEFYQGIANGSSEANKITISDGDSEIGETYWIFKNSWGEDWGDDGYAYVISDISQLIYSSILTTSVTSLNYTDDDIVCEDRDGDGYYNWGIGSKPNTCPCSPDTEDGDDTDPDNAAMDEYGNFIETTETYILAATEITNDYVVSETEKFCGDVTIYADATLTINGTVVMPNYSQIIVKEDGNLIVDGGLIKNSNIVVLDGGSLSIINNGILEKDFNDSITINEGAIFECTYGKTMQLE